MRARWLRWLEAERDAELRGWRRRRLERALERSPELRAERAALDAIGEAVRAAESAETGPSLWPGIDRELARDGAASRAPEPVRSRPGASPERLPSRRWLPAGLAVAAALAVAFLSWWRAPGAPAPPAASTAAHHAEVGRVLSLDTGGRPVWVQEGDGATIIWLVGDAADPV